MKFGWQWEGEQAVHSLLREQTEAPVPRIISFDSEHQRIDRDYLFMERMSGTPLSDFAGLTNRMFDKW